MEALNFFELGLLQGLQEKLRRGQLFLPGQVC